MTDAGTWPWRTVAATREALLRELRARCHARITAAGGRIQSSILAAQMGVASRVIRPILQHDGRFFFQIETSADLTGDGRRHDRLMVSLADAPERVVPEVDITQLPVFAAGRQ